MVLYISLLRGNPSTNTCVFWIFTILTENRNWSAVLYHSVTVIFQSFLQMLNHGTIEINLLLYGVTFVTYYATFGNAEKVHRWVRMFISNRYIFQFVKNVSTLFGFIFLARNTHRIQQSYPTVSGLLLKLF